MAKSKNGFTLIELLIVVAIIGILAAIAVPNFMNAQMKALITRTYADLKAMHSAMEMYRVDNNSYILDYDSGQVPGVSNVSMDEGVTYSKLTTPTSYMSTIPVDPFFAASVLRGFHPKKTLYFQYAGPFGKNPEPAQSWRVNGTIYTITSLGPDRTDQNGWSFPHEEAYTITFTLSNGIKSAGDIYMSNKGLVQ